jgi:hypothetical protein
MNDNTTDTMFRGTDHGFELVSICESEGDAAILVCSLLRDGHAHVLVTEHDGCWLVRTRDY